MRPFLPFRRQYLRSLGALALSSALPALTACGQRALSLALSPWIGYEPLLLARDFRWLPLELHLLETKSLGDSAQALRNGQADAACLTLDEVLTLQGEGLDLRVGLVFDVSAGADVVMVRENVRHLAELRGKRLGREANALGELMLQQALHIGQLSRADISLLNLAPDAQVAAWKAHQVDAVVTYEPVATQLQALGARRLMDSRDLPDTIFDVLVLRADRQAQSLEVLRDVVKAHFRALDHLHSNRQDALHRMASHLSISPHDVRLILSGINLPSLAANRNYLAGNERKLNRSAQNLAGMMQNLGLLKATLTFDHLVVGDWLPSEE